MARPKDKSERLRIVQSIERKERMKNGLKYTAIGLAIAIAVVGAGYGISKIPKAPQQVHWHAMYEVYANGNRVSFVTPDEQFMFEIQQPRGQGYLPAHLHEKCPQIIHNEAREGEGTLAGFFDYGIKGKLTNEELAIPSGASFAGDYKTNATNTIQLYLSKDNATWQKWTSDITKYSFHDGDRILLLYGSYTDDQIRALEDAYVKFDPQKDVC